MNLNLSKILHLDGVVGTGIKHALGIDTKKLVNRLEAVAFSEQITKEPFPLRQRDEDNDAFIQRLTLFNSTLIRNLSNNVVSAFSSSGHSRVRQRLAQEPIASGLFFFNPLLRISVSTNRFPGLGYRSESNQVRIDAEVDFAGLLYFVLPFIVRNPETRILINRRANSGVNIPVILQELLRSTRNSTCGNFEITTDYVPFPDEYLDLLELRNTLLDIDYLCSPAGVDALFDLFAFHSTIEDNYIKFEQFTQGVDMNAGHTTSAMSLSNEMLPIDTSVDNRTVNYIITPATRRTAAVMGQYNVVLRRNELRRLSGHSYGENCYNSVHNVDAYLTSQYLYDTENNQRFIIRYFSERINIDVSVSATGTYVCHRMCKDLRNDPKGKFHRAVKRQSSPEQSPNAVRRKTMTEKNTRSPNIQPNTSESKETSDFKNSKNIENPVDSGSSDSQTDQISKIVSKFAKLDKKFIQHFSEMLNDLSSLSNTETTSNPRVMFT